MLRVLRVVLLAGALSAGLALAATSRPGTTRALQYVALGDSFSSGEGVPPYREASNRYLPPHDICHRSYRAYPQLIAGRRSSPGTWSFWACSGARLHDLTHTNRENPHEVAQLDRIAPPGASDPRVDLGHAHDRRQRRQFNVVWIACLASHAVSPLRGACRGNWRGFVTRAIARLRTSLPPVLRDLRSRAPRARILVLGYADPFPARLPAVSRCSLWFSAGDMAWLGREGATLNGAIRDAARASGARITYVPPHGFAGHDVCSNDPWFNGIEVTPGRTRGSFHPNVAGQRQLAREVNASI